MGKDKKHPECLLHSQQIDGVEPAVSLHLISGRNTSRRLRAGSAPHRSMYPTALQEDHISRPLVFAAIRGKKETDEREEKKKQKRT